MGPFPEDDFHNEGGLLAEEDADGKVFHFRQGREVSQLAQNRFLNPADF